MTILPDPKTGKPVITGVTARIPIESEVVRERSVAAAGSSSEIDDTQAAVTDIGDANINDFVYLKKIKDPYLESIDGEELSVPRPNIAFTFVRDTPEINNESGVDYVDNVVGAFNSWDNGGLLLGTIKPNGIREIPYSDGYVGIKPSAFNTYFNEEPTNRPKFKPEKIDKSNTVFIKKDGQEIECYVITKDATMGGVTDKIPTKDFMTGEFIDKKAPDQSRYIRKEDCTEIEYVWYNISFTQEASDLFLNGYVRDGNNIRTPEGAQNNFFFSGIAANDALDQGTSLQEYSVSTEVGTWMRFDTLAATEESALAAAIATEPEIINEPTNLTLVETYRGVEIYEQNPGDLAAFDSEGNPITNPPTFEVAEDVLFNEQVAIAAGESFLNIEEIKLIIDQINL
jgi:hypothetical protein